MLASCVDWHSPARRCAVFRQALPQRVAPQESSDNEHDERNDKEANDSEEDKHLAAFFFKKIF